MSPNNTTVDLDLIYTYSSVLEIAHFFAIFLPAFILCVLCVVALVLARSINLWIRVSLINVFAAQMCFWLGFSTIYIGYPVRAYGDEDIDDNFSCLFGYSINRMANTMVSAATLLYAVLVYCIIKYGKTKIKWYAVVIFITVSWAYALLLGAMPYFAGIDDDLMSLLGFCRGTYGESLFFASAVLQLVSYAISLCAIFIFCILIFCYTKKNTLGDNAKVKRAVIKNLVYLLLSNMMLFFANAVSLITVTVPPIYTLMDVDKIVLSNFLFPLLTILPSLAIPIATIIILKPVRLALRLVFKACCCKKKRPVDPEASLGTGVQDVSLQEERSCSTQN